MWVSSDLHVVKYLRWIELHPTPETWPGGFPLLTDDTISEVGHVNCLQSNVSRETREHSIESSGCCQVRLVSAQNSQYESHVQSYNTHFYCNGATARNLGKENGNDFWVIRQFTRKTRQHDEVKRRQGQEDPWLRLNLYYYSEYDA